MLVGPSGCGKTTLMRMINRMIEPSSGDILLDGKSLRDRNPSQLRREIGYAIQQIGLFPHLKIKDNIAIVPRLLGWDKERITRAAWTSCSSWCSSTRTTPATATRASSRAASSSASAWPGRSPPTRR